LMVWLAASIAMLSYFALNELFISFVISLIDGESSDAAGASGRSQPAACRREPDDRPARGAGLEHGSGRDPAADRADGPRVPGLPGLAPRRT
jgi:hypothetical protein